MFAGEMQREGRHPPIEERHGTLIPGLAQRRKASIALPRERARRLAMSETEIAEEMIQQVLGVQKCILEDINGADAARRISGRE